MPESFDLKVTTIKEAQDISIMKVDKLTDSMLTFDMVINDTSKKKGRCST